MGIIDKYYFDRILYDCLSSEKIDLIIFPTEHCNFRCIYCYEDFLHGKMGREVVEGLKALISNRSTDLKYLSLSWFGGEPLIAYDIVLDLSHYAISLAAEKGFIYNISMTTNGYALSRDRIIDLYNAGIRSYQISLDGDKIAHDQTRLRAYKADTFDRIWKNIIIFNDLINNGEIDDTCITLRIHCHTENINSVKSLIENINNKINPSNFNVFLKDIGHYGGPADGQFPIFDALHDFSETRDEILQGLSDKWHVSTDDDHVHICYAAKANAFTIRADGSVGKCTVALKSDRNRIGWLHPNGDIELDPEKASLWLHALSAMDRDDLACPLHRLPKLGEE